MLQCTHVFIRHKSRHHPTLKQLRLLLLFLFSFDNKSYRFKYPKIHFKVLMMSQTFFYIKFVNAQEKLFKILDFFFFFFILF